jgi:site-specific DNA-cytosine methylase
MAERPLYTLYKNLKAQNYDVPNDYDKFESALTRDGKSGADNRHAIYENLKAQNFDVPDTYERFYSALFEPRSKTSSRAKGGSVPMSAADRARFSAGAAAISASAQQTMNNVGRYNRLKQRKQKQQKDFGRVNLGTHKTAFGGDANNVVKDDFAYNPETGKAGAYVTSDNDNAYTQNEAEQKQAILDEQNNSYQQAVDTGEIPSVLDVRDKNGNYDLQENIGKNGTYLTEEGAQRQFDKKLADAYARKKEIEALIAEDNRQHGNPLLSYGASIGAGNGRTAQQSDYRNKLATSLSLVTEQIGALEAVKQYPTSSWGEDALKALDNTVFTAKTWDFGLTDFATMGQMERIKTKMDNNIPLSGSDNILLKSKLGADAAAALEDEKMGNIYRWTKIAGQSLPFMADFFLTGGYGGITKGISSGALKIAAKRGMGKVSAAILKNTGIVAGDIIGSYAMAGTEQAMKTGADIMQRHLGNLYQDEKGDYKFGTFDENGNLLHEGGESIGTALYKGLTSAMVENYTEKLFGHNYGIKKGAIAAMEKHGMDGTAQFFKNIGKSGWYTNSKKWMEKFGINGFGEEVMEEEIGIPLHALLDGDNNFSDLGDAKQQLDIIGGMAISVGSMYAMGAGSRPIKGIYNRAQYYRFRNKVNVADNDAQSLFGDNWADIKDKIDNATNEQMGGVLADILRQRDTMNKEQINAAVNYGVNLMKMRGYNIAKTAEMNAKEIANEPTTPEEQHQADIDNAYSEGHDADDADKHNIQLEQNDKANELAAMLHVTPEQLHDMADEDLEAMTGQNDKLDQAIYDYQVSTAKYQGVMDGAQDEVDMAAHQAAMETDNMTDLSRGTVRKATIKATGGLEDYEVYIISGNIATHDDGSIDVGNSDDMIIYYDPTTGRKEHADAMMFADLIEELPAADVKAQAINDAKENAIKKIAGIIDGTVEVGSQFSVTDADGTEHTYEVLADNGDGTAMITIDGNVPTELVKGENVQIPYSFADLQQMKDMEDQKRLETAKAEREQIEKERAAKQTQETEETQSSFDFNQILNDDGNVVLVDVLDEDGNTKYPNSKLFLIRDTGAKAKVVELKSDGTIVPHAVNKEDVATISSMSLDEYKKAMPESSMIEDNSGENRGEIEVETPTIEGETAAPAEETAAPESAETPATEQTPAMTLEDGTEVPMLEDGNPDFSKLTAEQTAELYDSQFGEDADGIVSGYVSDAKKALDKANNMTVKGKNFVEQKAAKQAKEKAIADAQAAYDSAVAIRDAYNERQLAKVEDTADGRKNLIEKARRRFSRLKSAVKDDAEAVAQIYKETVGSLLHRLYDGTGIDVTDTNPLTAEEYVASNLSAHTLNYEGTETSKGVKQETGLSREDFAKTQLLAADGKGTTIDNLVHSLWENRPSNLDSLNTQDIRNALIGVLTSGFKASEARSYVENIRIAQAEKLIEEERTAAENAAYYEQQKAKEEEEKKKAELEKKAEEEKKKAEEEKTEDNEQTKFPDKLKEGSKAIEAPGDATDEKPFGEQLNESDLPFSAKENGKQQTTAERAADVEKNKVDDMKVVDNIVGQKTRKAFARLAKMMGANIQWQYSDKLGNGWIQETKDADGNVHRTIFITLDSSITEGAQFIFGHEMTHQIKNLNPAAYNELTQLVLDTYGSDAFDNAVDETMKRYSDAGFSGRAREYYAEEVVADAVGEMIRDLNLAHTLAMKMSHPLLAAIHEILQKIKLAFFGTEYSDVTKNIIRSIEQAYVKTAKGEVTNSETDEDVSFSLRQKPEPKKKGIGYKVFVLKDGKLYPPMVANPDGAATPVGVWLDADAAPIAGESKTGRPQVKQGGKGTQGGSGKLAYRPGWHLGVVPYAIQFNRKDDEGNKTLFPKNFVFAEVEYAADVDYQEEARQEGINPSGKYQHSLAGLKHLPTDGYYMYRTNPNPETDPWVITGAMKVNRILTRAEQAELVKNAGREPQQIQEGDIVTDDVVSSINQEIAAAPKFSLKVYHGSGADFTEFDFDHMGEGDGSQVFGWGGYVTSSKKIGKNYATLMDNDPSRAYYRIQHSNGTRFAKKYPTLESFLYGDKQIAMNDKFTEQEKIDFYNEMKKLAEPYHNLYEVDIPDDNGSNYMDWDKPLSKNQQDAIREGLEHLGVGIKTLESKGQSLERTGENVYNSTLYIGLSGTEYDLPERTKGISKFLSSVGFTGVKYKAGRNFGGAKKGDTNYVIFKPEDMRITEHTKFSIKTYHGSQASFDKFDHSFMGSGEGAQAYGWGTYVSEVEGIAKAYAKANAKKNAHSRLMYQGKPMTYKTPSIIYQVALDMDKFNISAKEAISKMIDADEKKLASVGDTPFEKMKAKQVQDELKVLKGLNPSDFKINEDYDTVAQDLIDTKPGLDLLEDELKDAKSYVDLYQSRLDEAKEELSKAKESGTGLGVDMYESDVMYYSEQVEKYKQNVKTKESDIKDVKTKIDALQKKLDSMEKPRNLYTVEIPDDNGDNYLDWDGKAPDGLKEKVLDRLYNERREDFVDKMRKAGFNDDQIKEEADYTVNKEEMADTYLKHSVTGGGLYRDLSYYLGEQKKASLFLKDMGIDGVKVIAKRNTGGNKEGKMNYVIFDENNAHITNHTKFSLRLKSAIEDTETNPSDAQKESGNYKKGHIKFGGYDYTIENPKGSTRSGKDADGKEWKVTMHDTYGYIRGKFGKDGDHLDMFINDKADLDNWNGNVFVVDQVNPDGSFDEHKVMYGYDSMDDAKKAYLSNYSDGWQGLGNITGVSKDEFDKWLDTSNRKLKPFADYAKVKFSFKDIKPVGVGAFGNIYNQFRGNAKAAIEFLKKVRGGEAVGALHHKDIGDIDLVWGKEGTGHSDGYGLSKLVKYHPEVLDNLQEILNDMRVVSSSKNRVNLESETHKAGVRLTWDGERKSWLLTAFKKETSASDKRTDTVATSLEGDTALSQTEGSAAKIDNSSETAKENGEKFSLKDDEYLKAVENGDMEKAQKMVNEAAEAAGYSTDSSYQGTSAFNGSAPWGNGYFLTKEERKEAWDNEEYDGDQTLGDYIHRGIDAMNLDFIALDPRNYRAADPMRKEAIDNVRNAIQKKSETITMYRSVPSDVKEGSFRNGDWVTPSRAYAVDNAKVHGWGDNFNIIEQKVPVDEIWWDGNDIAEWGYGREEDYVNDTDFAYKNTKNNRKLLDAVTYDDNGNVIPLSQRFNENNADVRYSLKDEKTMFGMHNISLDKLRKAIKQGGFAAPSMGVTDSKNGIYSGYGEITLIPKAEKIAKRTGKNIGTYAADAWTPIYPPVEKKFGGNGGDVAYDDIESVPKEMQSLTRNAINSFMDGRDTNSLAYLYLHEKGKAPELVHVEGKYPKELHDEVKGILGKLDSIYSTTDEQKEKLLDLFIREVYDGNREEFDNDIKNFIKKDEEFIKKRPNSNIAKNKQLDVDWMKEHGYDYGALSRFVDGILRDAETSGKVDENATMKAAQQYIQDNGMKEDFDSWKEKLNDRYNVEEVIFAGYKADGNRKYLPNTVENAVKVMKQDGKNASVGSASFSHFVASILKPMGTLDQIRKKKGNLTDNYEDVEKFQEKWQPVYDELADKMQPDAGPFESYGMDRLEDAATQKNPKKYAKDEYGVDLTDEDIDKLNELIDAVKNEKPSIYFETKFMRPYGLDEFEKAIVPNDTPSDVVDALKMAGIDVSSYERGNAEDRQKVTMDAINSSDNIRFSLAGERGAAAADKAEERTARMDNLSVARKMEEEKKDAKAIKMATGWERGADGKWRYEMPDVVLRDPKEWVNKKTLTLSDIVEKPNDLFKEYPELFDAYPELKDMKILKGRAKSGGVFYNNAITLNLGDIREAIKYDMDTHYKLANNSLKKTLVHEIQHYIQDKEGFAQGGNSEMIIDKNALDAIAKLRAEKDAVAKEFYAMSPEEQQRRKYEINNRYNDLTKQIERLEKSSRIGYDGYNRLSGEVEARNVSARLNMTPEERRKSLAESTEDVARKDQIFLGVGDVSFSLRDMADGKESGAADMAEDLKSLNTPDEVDDAIKTAIDDMPSGWKMANKKMIHIAQALGENRKAEIAGEEPKFSLKDGSLIKAGTYFSGGGLVEEGLKGIIDPVVAVEYDEKISGVYRNNFGQHIVTADVRDVDPKELVKQIDGEVEYFHASPVCKNYSQAKSNHAEVELDKETAASTAEFINAVKPKVVTIENVKGYKDSEAMKIITDALDADGYTWDADVYNAADFGGYTNRERLIVRAVRDGQLPAKPKKMERKSGWYEAVADIIPTLTEKKNGVAPWMDIRLKADGIDWRNIDKPLYVMGSAYADGKIPHAFADELLPTLRTKSGDVIVMPDGKVYRAMGRVLARVSGVSDDYKMPFSENLSHTIIGNGIPTQLTEHVIAPLLQNTLRPTTPEDGNTKFSLRYDQFEHDLNQWKKDNNLPKDAQRPTIPQRNAGESSVDFLRRVDEYRKQMALWKTAPTYEQHLLSDDTALGEFNRELQCGSVLKRIAFQDSMLAIRKAQEAIMKEVGVDRLNMAEDAYTAENRSHGKGKNEFEEYNNEFLQPLRKAYHQMKKVLGDSYDNVRIYMMAKHGLERDAQMAFKKSLEADYEDVAQRSAAYKAYKGDMNRIINDSDLEYGRVDFNTWRQRDNALRTKYSPSYMNYRYDKMGIAYDYSGLSALFDGSDFEETAHKLIKDIESKYVTETHNLWDATNAATKKILRDGYKAGMMSKDTYQYVRDMYSHYIPLRGWDGTTADQVWDYIGGGKGAFNQTLKKAHGRTSIADDPIAYIENMAESGILLNNKNWVKQHLMLLAQNHPTSLLTLSKAWYVKSVDDNGNEEWIPATPQITSQMDSNQVKAAIDAFEKKMEQMAQTGNATQKRDGLNIAYPQTHSEEREHEVRVMKDGEEYVIYVNGDPQLAQAMNNTRAHRVREIQSGKLDRAAAWLGRKMAAAYTSLSPLFIPSNYFRDLTMTLASTAIREDAKYNYLLRKNLATSWNLGFMLKDYQNGKLREKVSNGNATPKEQMFYDFMMNGGETGFVSSLDVEDLKKKFKNDLKDLDRWKANPVKVGHTIMDVIEFLNRMIEDSNRFAIYMTSIQYGRSIDEAVNDAKDVTLNFNRKGTGEYGWQMIRNLYLFINPAVQSLQTLGALGKHHPFKFMAVTASWIASGVLVPIVNAALMQIAAAFGGGDGDDKKWYKDISKKYWQFTKWDRRNNLIMWFPFTHEFIKIPLAQEFRAFYGVGDMIASNMMGGKLAEESWSQYAEDLLGQVVDMLPLDPTGYDGNIAVSLMPNAVRPIFELAFNVDFTGKPLFKETEYNKYDPNFTKAYVGTPDWLVRASRMMNSIGNDYPDVQQNKWDALGNPRYNLNNPAVVDHVLSSYLGGAYTMGSQVLGVLTKSLNDPKEIKVADIPLFSKFVSNPDDRPASKKQGDEFWDKKEYYDRASNTISKLKKQAKIDGDYSLLERFYGSEEYKTYKLYEKDVKDYKETRKKERAEESGDEYKPHQINAEDIYNNHTTSMDEFEDMKLKQLFEKLNSFKNRYDAIVDNAPNESDGYYNTNKAAIDAIDEISLDKQEISELKKGFLDDGKDAYNAEDMKQIRELRKKILSVLEKANKVVVANQKAKAKKK